MSNNPFMDYQEQFFKLWNDNMDQMLNSDAYKAIAKNIPGAETYTKAMEAMVPNVENYWKTMASSMPAVTAMNPVMDYWKDFADKMPGMDYFKNMPTAAQMMDYWKNFADAAKMMGTFHGVDADDDGKTDRYSIIIQKLEYIDTLDLTPEQKTRLAQALGISDKNIRRKAPWW